MKYHMTANLLYQMNAKLLKCHVADIMKRTEKSQPDYDNLRRAISALEEVMTYALLRLLT